MKQQAASTNFALRTILSGIFIVAVCSFCPMGCGGDGGDSSGTFAGRAASSDAYVAIVTDGHDAVAYLCDGATAAKWFMGPVSLPDVVLQHADGSRLTATLNGGQVSGHALLADGRSFPFTISRVTGDGALYRAAETVNEVEYTGGWIILDDGSQRGAVLSRNTIISTQTLNTTTTTATINGIGTLQPVRLDPGLSGMQMGNQFGQLGTG